LTRRQRLLVLGEAFAYGDERKIQRARSAGFGVALLLQGGQQLFRLIARRADGTDEVLARSTQRSAPSRINYIAEPRSARGVLWRNKANFLREVCDETALVVVAILSASSTVSVVGQQTLPPLRIGTHVAGNMMNGPFDMYRIGGQLVIPVGPRLSVYPSISRYLDGANGKSVRPCAFVRSARARVPLPFIWASEWQQ